MAFSEGFFFDQRDVEGDVLPLAARIGETEIDIFDVVVLDQFEDVFGRLGHLNTYPFLQTNGRASGSPVTRFRWRTALILLYGSGLLLRGWKRKSCRRRYGRFAPPA